MHRFAIAILTVAVSLALPGVAAAATPLVEGESSAVQKSSGMEWRIVSPSTASGGKALKVISPGTLTATVTPTADTTLVLRDRTDNAARAAVTVDGASRTASTGLATSYRERSFGPLAAGSHTVRIQVSNLGASNYFLDYIGSTGSAPPPPPSDSDGDGVADSADQCPGTAPGTQVDANGCPVQTPPPPSGETRFNAYITGFGYPDNTPPNSAAICCGVLHSQAGGTGTYADPITLAVGHVITNGNDVLDYPAGTRFYIPNLRRYFIVEDACGDGNQPQNGPCHTGYPSNASAWLDVWVGGVGQTASGTIACEEAITDVHLAIKDPAATYAVVSGQIYGANGCTQQYGDTVVSG